MPRDASRELQPALDDYLNAFVRATRGYSGWPLNVFLTPEGYPLLGTVYLPPGQFQTLLRRVTAAWHQDRHVRRPDTVTVGDDTRRHSGNGGVSSGRRVA